MDAWIHTRVHTVSTYIFSEVDFITQLLSASAAGRYTLVVYIRMLHSSDILYISCFKYRNLAANRRCLHAMNRGVFPFWLH